MSTALLTAIEVARRTHGRLRAVAYLRVSTEDQKKGYGIAYSKKKVLAHFEKKGWDLVGVFADEGFSGSLEARLRPDLTRLMEQSRQTPRPFDVVGVLEGRVIGRRDRAFWPWVWELEDLGIATTVVKGDYDNTTPEGRSRMRKAADRAEDERQVILERTQGGIQEKAELGLYPGGTAPFGYEVENPGKKGLSRYRVSPRESEVARRALEVLISERDWGVVAATLNQERLLTRSGRPWTAKNLRGRVMSKCILESRLIWRGAAAETWPDGTPVHGDQVVIPLAPVFSEEEIGDLRAADAACKRRAPRGRAQNPRAYPLARRMVTPCGSAYFGHNNRPGSYVYRCLDRTGGAGTCACVTIEAPSVEGYVWREIRELLGDADRTKRMVRDWVTAQRADAADLPRRIADLDQQIAEQTAVIDAAMTTAARQAGRRGLTGRDAAEAVNRVILPLNTELDELETLRRKVSAWQEDVERVSRRAADLEALALAARTQWSELDGALQEELYDLLSVKVQVHGATSRRRGIPCKVTAWFHQHQRRVPQMSDAAWRRVAPILSGSTARIDRRGVVEILLEKARTGMTFPQAASGISVRTLQTTAHRWLSSGAWAQAMDELRDLPGAPPWEAPLPEITISLRPPVPESNAGKTELSPYG